jgi:hypothetical protein
LNYKQMVIVCYEVEDSVDQREIDCEFTTNKLSGHY